MSPETLLFPVVVPAAAGLLSLALARRERASGTVLVAGMLANLWAAAAVFRSGLALTIPLGGFDLALGFRVDALSSFVVLAAAVLGLLVSLFTARFMQGRRHAGVFFGFFLLTVAMVNGAALADHLITLLFFWEAMMVSLYVLIAVGHPGAWRTAVKAFFISGVTDLCMMAGIALVARQAGTLVISEVHLGTAGLSGLAFVLLAVGATSKAGSMPFHSWIPDAAVDAPAPFMALVPGILEKLLGVYFLARISLDMFTIGHGWASTMLMTLGAVTILLAVLMALVQKDYKRLLSFHAISQVGYMILGIGTGTTVGIVGGLFHMVNHAMYKGTLFLTGGAVERQAGTTDLRKLGGLAARMPVTFLCFLVAALSISGVYPFNGFFSKELVYDGALERGLVFYLAAAGGSFLTAASFLKLGHAAFFGKARVPAGEVKEAPFAMLVPMLGIAGLCVFFGVANHLPLQELVVPAVASHLEPGHHLGGLVPAAWGLVAVTFAVQLAAVAHHVFGVKRSGSALGAADHIHHAPVARQLYDAAERRRLDPYELAVAGLRGFARAAMAIDRAVDFAYERVVTALAEGGSALLRRAHTGSHAMYLAWSLAGLAAIVAYFVGGF
jgi:formate hydrogenlyase subunit 3/multisubunit Na+/H+ antiporter MnhD subunit